MSNTRIGIGHNFLSYFLITSRVAGGKQVVTCGYNRMICDPHLVLEGAEQLLPFPPHTPHRSSRAPVLSSRSQPISCN